ncbi:protein-L-isoaspartate O-methyltransferase [Colletotrichum tofieldiae]|nr:protein-L-isoaspartate O-methyltransferase [Colletotrichum tofieldiae]
MGPVDLVTSALETGAVSVTDRYRPSLSLDMGGSSGTLECCAIPRKQSNLRLLYPLLSTVAQISSQRFIVRKRDQRQLRRYLWARQSTHRASTPSAITIPRRPSIRRALQLLPSSGFRLTARSLHQTSVLDFKMAWRSSGATNQELVENMWKRGLIKDQRVKDAFLKVPSVPLPSGSHNGTRW